MLIYDYAIVINYLDVLNKKAQNNMESSRKPKIKTFAVKDHPFYSGVAT